MKPLKYITWLTDDGIPAFVMFPQHLQHRDVWAGIIVGTTLTDPIGAGFVEVGIACNGKFSFLPGGHSDSLRLGVHPTDADTLNP